MNDIDARLAARFAHVEPPADFDARFAARLAAEQQREARFDCGAKLQHALQLHARLKALRQRELRAALLRWASLGALGLLGVAVSVSWWQRLARDLAGAMATTDSVPLLVLTLGLPLLSGLAAALRPRGFVRALGGR